MSVMGLLVGSPVIGRYLGVANQVAIGEEYYDIIAESDDYLALFKPGRSVYKPNVGSEYDPARIYFAEIKELQEPNYRDGQALSGERSIKLIIHLEAPIRRR